MPTFIYTAKTKKGETRTGQKKAASENDLASLLREQNLFLIESEIAGAKKDNSSLEVFLDRFRLISLVEKMMFTRHLSIMIKAGFSLDRALRVLNEQSKNHKFKQIINQIEKDIRKGQSFAEALIKYPKVFDELYVNMIKVGEISGNLEEILKILAEQMKKDHELVSRVRGAMIYPGVIVAAMISIGILMMVMVVPKLNEVFVELDVELPLSTRIIIFLGSFLRNHLVMVFASLVIIIFLIRKGLRIILVKKMLHKILLFLPIFGSIIRKVNSARFAGIFGSLIEGGVSIVRALEITAGTLGNIFFKEALFASVKEVQKGEALSRSLIEYKHLYPPMVIQMIQVGEETGSLSDILKTLSNFYEEEVYNITKGLSAVIEPILMILVGAAVGFFAISVIQPIYSIMSGL